MAKIAVLIPYDEKHKDCFMEAVGSIEDQTYKGAQCYSIRDFPRLGKGFRMNKVVPYVTEEFVNIHDADDLSAFNRFEVVRSYLKDYDVIYHDIWIRRGLWNNRFWQRTRGRPKISPQAETDWLVHKSREWDRKLYKTISYVPASSIIVRTSIAKKVCWTSNTYGQDWIWLNLIAEHTDRFKYIPEPLLYYRGERGFTRELKFKSFRRWNIRRQIAKLTRLELKSYYESITPEEIEVTE